MRWLAQQQGTRARARISRHLGCQSADL